MVASGTWTRTEIDGAVRRPLQTFSDDRGALSEFWRASLTDGLHRARFVQANLSRSRAGVLRGMHFHRRQADLWTPIEGRALVALVDLRRKGTAASPASPADAFELGTGESLFIPPLVAHGFYALTELVLVYLVTEEFDGSDELGFAWNDPDAAIPWSAERPILSERDLRNPPLRTALANLRQTSDPPAR